jgi:hypothetical protein
LRIGESIENYVYNVGDDETEIADKAIISGASLRSTRLLLNESTSHSHEFVTTWEIHFVVDIFSGKRKFRRICIESSIDVDSDPREITNPEVLQWLTDEELVTLRTRMIWESKYPLMGSFDAFSDEVDIRVPEVRVWSPGELLRLLNMNETDANSLKENWERKQTYRKFGL